MRRWMIGSLVAGVLGALLVIIGWMASPGRAAYAYLTAYLYATSLAVGALFMVMISHSANVKWFVALRRIGENISGVFPLLALLFIPVFLGRQWLYPWSGERPHLDHHVEVTIEARRWWLNDVGFGLRSVLYLGILITFAELLRRWSIGTHEGEEGSVHGAARAIELAPRMRKLALGGLVAVSLTITFVAFDWAMSLDPVFYSNAFGVYYFAGSFLAGLSAIALCAALLLRVKRLPLPVGPEHLHALGRLMLAHTIFWAYIAFTQYMLVWIADLPEETPYYIARTSGGWYGAMLLLIFGHFALPFLLLLQRGLKRNPVTLAAIACWILLIHYADLYWIVLPALSPEAFQPHWIDLAALLAVVGLCLAFGIWRAAQVASYPLHDPSLPSSLRYEALL